MWANFYGSAGRKICSWCAPDICKHLVFQMFQIFANIWCPPPPEQVFWSKTNIWILFAFLSWLCPPYWRTQSANSDANISGKILASNIWHFWDMFVLTLSSLSEDLVLAEERTSKKDRQRIMEGKSPSKSIKT